LRRTDVGGQYGGMYRSPCIDAEALRAQSGKIDGGVHFVPLTLVRTGILMPAKLVFLIGGARSGKSQYAQAYAEEYGHNVMFVATAQALDDEMTERIETHKVERPDDWLTIEAPTNVADAIRERVAGHDLVVLDDVTLLASNVLLAQPEEASQGDVDSAILAEIDALIELIEKSRCRWVVISNEVGMGVVPPTKLGRSYRDALGRANQRLARAADEVYLMVAGLPFLLPPKGVGVPPYPEREKDEDETEDDEGTNE